jgi:hypothetical protein
VEKIHVLVNSERQANNVSALALDERLSKIARRHSQGMVNLGFFSHEDPDGKASKDRLNLAGYNCPKMSGENIFQNNLYSRVTIRGNRKSYESNSMNEIATSTAKEWTASPGHRQNILRKNYSRTGVGDAIAGNGQVLITPFFAVEKVVPSSMDFREEGNVTRLRYEVRTDALLPIAGTSQAHTCRRAATEHKRPSASQLHFAGCPFGLPGRESGDCFSRSGDRFSGVRNLPGRCISMKP